MRLTILTVCAALLAIAGPSPDALADTPPNIDELKAKGANELLKALDARHNHYPTQKWVFTMTLKPKSGEERQMKFSTWQKGGKRLVRFLEPGEVKGMSVLIKPGGTMYVYAPQTDNVRRVASHARRQTFMGSDLNMDDMAQIDFNVDFEATVAKDDAKHVWLDLKKKDGSSIGWSALKLRVNKKDALIDVIEYYDGARKVKTQSRNTFVVLDKVPTYKQIVVQDAATGHKTILDMQSQKIGQDIPNKVFTKRSLVRGN